MKILNFGLSVLALILAVLIFVNIGLSRQNRDVSAKLINGQQTISGARNTEMALRALTIRIAQGAVKDNALRDLLVKHQLRATIDVNGQQKEIP